MKQNRDISICPLVVSLLVSLLCVFMAKPSHAAEGVVTAAAPTTEDVALSIGRSAAWTVSAAGEISVSNGAILRVVDQGHIVKITALKLGSAVVRSGARRLEVNVLPEQAYRLYESLRDAVHDRRGLEVSAGSGNLKVIGRLLRSSDWLAIAAALSDAPAGKFTFQAQLEPNVETEIRKALDLRLAAVGLSHVDLRFTPAAIASVGTEPKDARERAEKILSPFGIHVDSNASVLSLEPMVRVKILVAEIKKNFKRTFGVQWPSSISGVLLPTSLLPSEPLEISLQALEDHGWGRILASPTLQCRSGKEAEFMAGGEFPIKLASYKSSNVIWKNYGVLLRVKPLADVSGRMSIAIETEVSALDDAHTVDGVPGLLTNRMQTHFDLSSSRTIALSGLIKNDLSRHTSGLPGLSSIPILGALFSSEEYKDDRSELMIFVTPEVSHD